MLKISRSFATSSIVDIRIRSSFFFGDLNVSPTSLRSSFSFVVMPLLSSLVLLLVEAFIIVGFSIKFFSAVNAAEPISIIGVLPKVPPARNLLAANSRWGSIFSLIFSAIELTDTEVVCISTPLPNGSGLIARISFGSNSNNSHSFDLLIGLLEEELYKVLDVWDRLGSLYFSETLALSVSRAILFSITHEKPPLVVDSETIEYY